MCDYVCRGVRCSIFQALLDHVPGCVKCYPLFLVNLVCFPKPCLLVSPFRLMVSMMFSPVTVAPTSWATACPAWCTVMRVWGTGGNRYYNCCGGLFWELALVRQTGFSWLRLVLTSTTLVSMRAQLPEIQWLIDLWRSVGGLPAKLTIRGSLQSLGHSSLCSSGLLGTIHFKRKFVEVWKATFEKTFAHGAKRTLLLFLLKIAHLLHAGGKPCFIQCHGRCHHLLPLFLVVTIPRLSNGTSCTWCHTGAGAISVRPWSACCAGPWVCLWDFQGVVWKKIDVYKLLTVCWILGLCVLAKACGTWKSSLRKIYSGSWTVISLIALAKPVIAPFWPNGS